MHCDQFLAEVKVLLCFHTQSPYDYNNICYKLNTSQSVCQALFSICIFSHSAEKLFSFNYFFNLLDFPPRFCIMTENA